MGEHWRKRCVAFTMARSPAMNGHAKASYCDVVEHLGTWQPIDRPPTPVSLSEPAVSQANTVAGVEQCLKLICSEDLFTPRRYLGSSGHESHRRRESKHGGGSPVARCAESWDLFQLLYNGNLIQSA